jgi:hypothetical protein
MRRNVDDLVSNDTHDREGNPKRRKRFMRRRENDEIVSNDTHDHEGNPKRRKRASKSKRSRRH